MIKAIIARGIGFSLGSIKWIITHGLSQGAVIEGPVRDLPMILGAAREFYWIDADRHRDLERLP